MRAFLRNHAPAALYRAYRRARIQGLTAGYKPRTVTHRYGETVLTLRLADPLAEGWYDHDWLEPHELALVRHVLPGALVFDIGAHQAVHALMMAAHGARVIAVEASAHNAAVAAEN